jgi:DNA-binding NtrC family response regulator
MVSGNLESARPRVLVIVEDPGLADLLRELLGDSGHDVYLIDGEAELRAALARVPYHAAIVDLDTRARTGAGLIAVLREHAPHTPVIALLPCGGLPPEPGAAYHLAIEKPARLQALLTALATVAPRS